MPEEKKKVGTPLVSLLILVILLGTAGYLLKGTAGKNQQAPTNAEEVRTDGDDFEGLAVFPSWSVLEPATFPLIVDGEAKGIWFFEANFPIEIILPSGEVLARGYTQAQEDPEDSASTDGAGWMTEEVIPFYAELKKVEGAPEHSGMATLILRKANPSGLPQYDAKFTTQIFVNTVK